MKLALLLLGSFLLGNLILLNGQEITVRSKQGQANGVDWRLQAKSIGVTEDIYHFDLGALLSNKIEVEPIDTFNQTINLSLRSFDLQFAYQYAINVNQLTLYSIRKKSTGAIWDKYIEDLAGSFPPVRDDYLVNPPIQKRECQPDKVLQCMIEDLAGLVNWNELESKKTTLLSGISDLGPYQVVLRAWQPGDYQRESIYDIWWPERGIRIPLQISKQQIQLTTHLMQLTYYQNERAQAVALRAQAASSLRLELISMIQQMQGKRIDSTANWQEVAFQEAATLLNNSLEQSNPMLFYHLTLPESQGGCGFPTPVNTFTLPSADWFFLGYPAWWYPVAYAASNIIHESANDWVYKVSIGRGLNHPLPYLLEWSDSPASAAQKLTQFGWIASSDQQWQHPTANQFSLITYFDKDRLQRIAVSQQPYPTGLAPAIPQMVNRFDEVFLTLLTLQSKNDLDILTQFSQGEKLCPVGFQRDTLSITPTSYQCWLPKAYPEMINTYNKRLKDLLPAPYVSTFSSDTLIQSNPVIRKPVIQDFYTFTAPANSPYVFPKQKLWPSIVVGYDAVRDGIFIAIDQQ